MVVRLETLAIVQARGGSKGLPNKNLLLLSGHPLISYSIASARAARHVTRLIVSTDSQRIADVARDCGAEIPFMRPAELAQDDTRDFPVIEHAISWLWQHEGYRPDIIVQLRPTSPLRPKGLIDAAIERLECGAEADCIRSVSAARQTPYKMWRTQERGYLAPLIEMGDCETYNMPRQELPQVVMQTGHVDVFWTSTVLEKRSLTGRKVIGIDVDSSYCVDIDRADDLAAASRAITSGQLEIDLPPRSSTSVLSSQSHLPATIDLVVFDFDGVFTNNQVILCDDGRESVALDRSDGLGISLLRKAGIPILVLSTEVNPLVAMRCRKLGIDCQHGLTDKLEALTTFARQAEVSLARTVYVGYDINDLLCMTSVGCSIAPADANPDIRARAKIILNASGGHGAVREVCDMIVNR
jgi:N-acylneuraminate cytidylyltransferase